ncbi:MAG: AraC family transcriptional regulator [Sphingomonadales bacterium 63-6]|nr:MAG: AraC family transcriptional regulator [Sphingomonadales bacterium 63-6]
MTDPLTQIMALLRPRTVFTKGISGAGRWAVRYSDFGQPSFCTVLTGSCRLALDGLDPVTLQAGDFLLLPTTPGFIMSGFEPAVPVMVDAQIAASAREEIRHGRQDGPPDVQLLGGCFLFDSPDADLLVSLLPPLVLLRDADRAGRVVRLLREEALEDRAGRDLVLARLMEVLLVEALRTVQEDTPAGLLRGLADPRLSDALRLMHGDPAGNWTVGRLADAAALSRSAFFERFTRVVGMAPMEYLLAWRMALARDFLRTGAIPLAEVAERTGYGSPSAFSTAFARHTGVPPGRFAREAAT